MIHLRQITKVYASQQQLARALGPVNLHVAPAESLAIVGPSGAGKTTLLSIMGLIDRPTSGEYQFAGRSIEAASDRELAALRSQHIGFVFQRFHLIDELTVAQNVGLPLLYRGWTTQRRRRAVGAALEQVGLQAKAHRWPAQLSGGEQQRVAIARALVGEPSIILADEPTGNLDTQNGQMVLELLLELQREVADRILVIVTHNKKIASQLARVVIIRDGQIDHDGPPMAVLDA